MLSPLTGSLGALGSANGAPADADAAAFIAAAGLTDPTQIDAVRTLVSGLKGANPQGANLWPKVKASYPIVGGTATAHKWNLKDPRDLDAAFRILWTGPLVHSSTGVKPNGIDQCYGNTNLIPAVLDSIGMSYYSGTDSPAGDKAEMGAYNSPSANLRTHLIVDYQGNFFYYGMNEVAGTNVAGITKSSGLFAASRTTSSLQKAYIDGAVVGTSNQVSSGVLPNIPIFICQLNGYTMGVTDRECRYAAIYDGLTDTEHAAERAVVQAYQTTLGRQV